MGLMDGNYQLAGKGDGKDQVIDLVMPSIKREVSSFEAQDPLIKVNLRTVDEPRQTKINSLLS